MKEAIHPPMTGLELRFEQEMGRMPHWRPWMRQPAHPRKTPPRTTRPTESALRDAVLEEVMVLGR